MKASLDGFHQVARHVLGTVKVESNGRVGQGGLCQAQGRAAQGEFIGCLMQTLPHSPNNVFGAPPVLQDLLKGRDLPVSGVKADLISRLEENDAAATAETSAGTTDPQPAPADDSAAPAAEVQTASTAEASSESRPSTLAVKRAVLDDEADEQVKRMRIDEAAASAVPPAQAVDSAIPPKVTAETADPPGVGQESAITASVIAEAKVPVETLERAAAGDNGEAGPGTTGASSSEARDRPREQQDFATSAEQQQEQVGADEEEEPPVYDFEAEEDSGRPADLYLDTVSHPLRVFSGSGLRKKPGI